MAWIRMGGGGGKPKLTDLIPYTWAKGWINLSDTQSGGNAAQIINQSGTITLVSNLTEGRVGNFKSVEIDVRKYTKLKLTVVFGRPSGNNEQYVNCWFYVRKPDGTNIAYWSNSNVSDVEVDITWHDTIVLQMVTQNNASYTLSGSVYLYKAEIS